MGARTINSQFTIAYGGTNWYDNLMGSTASNDKAGPYEAEVGLIGIDFQIYRRTSLRFLPLMSVGTGFSSNGCVGGGADNPESALSSAVCNFTTSSTIFFSHGSE